VPKIELNTSATSKAIASPAGRLEDSQEALKIMMRYHGMVGRGSSMPARALALAGALAGFAGMAAAQPFDPAQPGELLWGSAGFTDLAVLSSQGRGFSDGSCDQVCLDSDFIEIPIMVYPIPQTSGQTVGDVSLQITFHKFPEECNDDDEIDSEDTPFNNEIVYILVSPSGTTRTVIPEDRFDEDPYRGVVTFNFNDDFPPLPVLEEEVKGEDEVVAPEMPAGGSFAPEESFSAFNGESPFGLWTLIVADTTGSDALEHINHRLFITNTNGSTIIAPEPLASLEYDEKGYPVFSDCTCDNLKEVASIQSNGQTTADLRTFDSKSGRTTWVDFDGIGADANGVIFGIAEAVVNGNVREASVVGRAKFSEKAEWAYDEAEEVPGKSIVTPTPNVLPYELVSVERLLNHKVGLRAKAKGLSVGLKLADRSVRTDYEGFPLVMTGTLKTSYQILPSKDGDSAEKTSSQTTKGISDVFVVGIIDRRAEFLISADSITATPQLTRWNGDAMLCTPFNVGQGGKAVYPVNQCYGIPPCDAPWINGGFSTLNFKWYDPSKPNPAGKYSVSQRNEYQNSQYRATSKGVLLDGANAAQLLVDGDTSLSDLQYRAQTMSFRTNAASTTVKSTYLDERILRQLSGGGGGGGSK